MPGLALRRRERCHRRYLRRLLGSGGAAAPERESLALLPSGPDAVRTLPVRGTRSSTPRAQTLSRRTVPRTAFGPAWSGFRVQGTADSPPSVTGQAEGTTLATTIEAALVIDATLYTDAGCPWAYSANPALRVLEWRFREQLRWRLVMIGLREEPSESAIRTFDGERALARWRVYEERYGMPFGTTPKSRAAGTGRGCRAVVAAGMLEPGERVDGVSRAADRELHLDALPRRRREHPGRARLRTRRRRGCRRGAAGRRRRRSRSTSGIARRRDPPAGRPPRRRTRRPPRMASCGSPRRRSCSGAATTPPSPAAGSRCSPTTRCSRTSHPGSSACRRPSRPRRSLEFFPYGLATAEVALLLAEGSDPVPDVEGTERQLLDLVESGVAERLPLGRDALWRAVSTPT